MSQKLRMLFARSMSHRLPMSGSGAGPGIEAMVRDQNGRRGLMPALANFTIVKDWK